MFSFIPNLILVLALLGILAIFFRNIPQVVDQKNARAPEASSGGDSPSRPVEQFNNQALLKTVWNGAINGIHQFFTTTIKKIWHFMLQAKDLREGQIIAAKFARLVTPKQPLQNIGAFNNLKKAAKLAEENEFEQAEQLYILVIRKHPHEYQAYEGLLKIYLQQKKFDFAIEVLEFLVTHNHDHDGYLAQLGSAYLTSRRFEEAVEAYRRSIAINDLVPARFVNLGLSLQSTGEQDEALKHFQRAVDLEPANMQYLVIFVDGLSNAGQPEKATEMVRKGLAHAPQNSELIERLKNLENPM